jgi:hypothetical protein
MQVNSPETFVEVTSPTITFKKQAQWWLDEMRAGRIVSRKKRTPIKPATLAGYQAAVNWLHETIGSVALADIKTEVAKQLVIKMKAANLADETVVNYFQVVKAVVASAMSSEGEQHYPRNWNFHFIGLPVVDEKKQRKPSLTTSEVEQILTRAKGRYKVLFGIGQTNDTAQHLAKRPRKDSQGYEVGSRKVISLLSPLPNCTPAKEPRAVGLAKAVARTREQRCHRPLCRAVERRR